MTNILYSLIVIGATVLGAVAGLGGGIIIKPLLDLVGAHDAKAIGIYSSAAVFTMCVVSLAKQMRGGFMFDAKVVLAISLGSLVGGLLGEMAFSVIATALDNGVVKAVQAGLLVVTLALILVYTLRQDSMPSFLVKSPLAIFGTGLFLGVVSVFLGIGGGPLNVACMSLFFSYGMKESVVYSLATIFFSQLSKLALNAVGGTLFSVDLSFLPVVVASAILGGYIGTKINQRASDSVIHNTYIGIIVALLVVSVYNCAVGLMP